MSAATSIHTIAVGLLLAAGVLSFVFTSTGLLLRKDVYDQIHFLAPGSIIGSLCFAGAVMLNEGLSQSGVKAFLIALLLLLSNPVLSHAIARAARIRRHGQVLPDHSRSEQSSD